MVFVLGPKNSDRIAYLKQQGVPEYNTTSREHILWSQELSPFLLGPIKLYGNHESKNVENGWQYSKVYKQYTDEKGDPSPEYFLWAKRGWENSRAIRYPMGRGAKPEYSYWDGKKLGYIDARKTIYIPLYAKAVIKTEAFKKLKEIYEEHKTIILWDFDAYDHRAKKMTYQDVINDPTKKMGHAFVLAMLLEKELTEYGT